MPVDTIDLQTVVVRAADLVHNELDGEVTMMNIESGKYYGLTSSVAADVWRLLETPVPAGRICADLMTRYRVDRDRCESEVLAFLQRMAAEGVVRTQGKQGGVNG